MFSDVFKNERIRNVYFYSMFFLIILARKSVIKIKHNLFLPIFIYGTHNKVQFYGVKILFTKAVF